MTALLRRLGLPYEHVLYDVIDVYFHPVRHLRLARAHGRVVRRLGDAIISQGHTIDRLRAQLGLPPE